MDGVPEAESSHQLFIIPPFHFGLADYADGLLALLKLLILL